MKTVKVAFTLDQLMLIENALMSKRATLYARMEDEYVFSENNINRGIEIDAIRRVESIIDGVFK